MTKVDEIRRTGSAASSWVNSDEAWFKIGVVFGLFVVVTAGLASLIALFTIADPDKLNQRVDTIYKLALIGAAVVTFCTVAWRGLIATKQANAQLEATNLQRDQISKLAVQIRATEENNLAELLQKGAELITDPKPAKIAAGIAILRAVATSENGKFATEAMNLLADFLQENHSDDQRYLYVRAVIDALRAGAAAGQSSDRSLRFRVAYEDVHFAGEFPLMDIPGVRQITIVGGGVSGAAVQMLLDANTQYQFVKVKIEDGMIDVKDRFSACTFQKVKVRTLEYWPWSDNAFIECDFSGADIINANDLPDLREQDNYFLADNPPKGHQRREWKEILNVVEPPKRSSHAAPPVAPVAS